MATTTTTTSQPLYFALYLFFILHTASGYTTNLIHRDSPQSPFYNASSTHFDRLQNAFRRSLNRASNFKLAPMSPGGGGSGEYLMQMSIGTPPVEVMGIANFHSDLTWTQCVPCKYCYKQNNPLFNPTKSSSYKDIPCASNICQSLRAQSCNPNHPCSYFISYSDDNDSQRKSDGNLATETVTLGTTTTSSVSIPNILFGCAHDAEGDFDAAGSGIIGLSRSNLSLVSQLGGKKFSYCLVPSTNNSNNIISFGNDAVVSGVGVVTTPLVTKNLNVFDNNYYLILDAISVGTKRVPFVTPGPQGNIMIDSGTTVTLVPFAVHKDLESALDKVMIGFQKVDDPNGLLSPCYKRVSSVNVKLPSITAHFRGGDVMLNPVNTFSWVKEDVVCFTMHGNDGFAVYGNLAQRNFLVGYDIEAGTVSFKPTDCTKQH